MRISQIMLSNGFGGAERYFLDLSLALADAGHPLQVICHRDFVALPSLKKRNDIQLHTIPVWGKWDPFAPRQLYSLLASFKPDVVHAHLARGAFMAGKATKKAKLPLVVKTHNYVNLKYYRSVDHFITTTKDQSDYLTSHGVLSNRISVIPNFSRFKPAEKARDKPRTPPVFVAYGRMVHKKGFDLLLQAFAEFIAKGNTARLLIGGEGPDRVALEKLAENLGIAKLTEFSGWVNDVPEFLSRGDIFILPSRDEPFGIAVIEAMSSGTPIVATLTKGPTEILTEDTAFLVPKNDSSALCLAMQAALAEPDKTSHLATAALKKFRDLYAEATVLPKLLTLYQNLIISHGAKNPSN